MTYPTLDGSWSNRETSEAEQRAAFDKEIAKVDLSDDTLTLSFADGSKLEFKDDGQSCCEHRYFTADGDNLSEFVGAKYRGAVVKEAPSIETEWDAHDVNFLEILTSCGSITISAHNEHNGCYGGFSIVVSAA